MRIERRKKKNLLATTQVFRTFQEPHVLEGGREGSHPPEKRKYVYIYCTHNISLPEIKSNSISNNLEEADADLIRTANVLS